MSKPKSLDSLLREFLLFAGEEEADKTLRPYLESLLELAKYRREALKKAKLDILAKLPPSDGSLTEAQKEKIRKKFGR